MDMESLKWMNQDMVKLDMFDGSNFSCWQDKMKFLLTALKIFYILAPDLPPIIEDPKLSEDGTLPIKPRLMKCVTNANKGRKMNYCAVDIFSILPLIGFMTIFNK
ncbi:hypothetical protein POM88_040912 [Heracleum sosnowskyi]|uniref:Uncharacterized protein n=1 Tax=Heracleum sosnowskyi TaxID=360622 RepID=A0AAD8HF32_9APIA|nr:hypothetical protein POM88_040912 [Heracleum sosnowskyi]